MPPESTNINQPADNSRELDRLAEALAQLLLTTWRNNHAPQLTSPPTSTQPSPTRALRGR